MDMPFLNDARRVARLAMVVDELSSVLKEDDCHQKLDIGAFEFRMCGGKHIADLRYSLYRQLVYVTRDYKAYVKRHCFPSSKAVTKANSLFAFYSDDLTDQNDQDLKKQKDFHRVLRLLIVLQTCRKILKTCSFTRSDVKCGILKHNLTYDEYILCGGKKKRKREDEETFPLSHQLEISLNDLRTFLLRGRLPPPCVVEKAYKQTKYNTFDSSDEEEVDDLDGGETCEQDAKREDGGLKDTKAHDDQLEDDQLDDDEDYDDPDDVANQDEEEDIFDDDDLVDDEFFSS